MAGDGQRRGVGGDLRPPRRIPRSDHLSRRAWRRLRETSEDEVADATRAYLDPGQVAALKERRRLLVEHIQALIEERGEDAVLY